MINKNVVGSGSGGHSLTFPGSVPQNKELNKRHIGSGRNRDDLLRLEIGHRAGSVRSTKFLGQESLYHFLQYLHRTHLFLNL